jgi:hypothetical protein
MGILVGDTQFGHRPPMGEISFEFGQSTCDFERGFGRC